MFVATHAAALQAVAGISVSLVVDEQVDRAAALNNLTLVERLRLQRLASSPRAGYTDVNDRFTLEIRLSPVVVVR